MNSRKTSLLFFAAALGATALCSSMLAASHDQDPKIISRSEPLYSFDLRKAEFEGAVLVSFKITARGNVTDAVVVRSTNWVFDEPALNAVKKWKFAPAMKDGRPVDLPAMQLFTFTVPGRDSETSIIALIEKMKPRHAAPGIEVVRAPSHDRCFCGSGKGCDECHGAYAPRHSTKNA